MLTIVVGKSASGKDTLQSALCDECDFERVVTCTTRPMREGEVQDVDYHFMDKDEFLRKIEQGDFIEHRAYNTLVEGNADTWFYGSLKQPLRFDEDYVIILDPQGAKDFLDCYGVNNCFVVSLEVGDIEREERAMKRGSFDKTEWDRRLADDAVKFNEETLDSIANFRLPAGGYVDAETVLCDVYDALEAYKSTVQEIGRQYVVERDIIGGYGSDSLDPPEEVFRVYDKEEYQRMLAVEDRMATMAEYGAEFAAEKANFEITVEAVDLFKEVLEREFGLSKSAVEALDCDESQTDNVEAALHDYINSNGKGMVLMKEAIETHIPKAVIDDYKLCDFEQQAMKEGIHPDDIKLATDVIKEIRHKNHSER